MTVQATYVNLGSVVVSTNGTTSDIGFGSIPQTYTDLRLVVQFRTDYSSSSVAALYFNSDSSTTNRSDTYIMYNGSSLTSGRETTVNRIQVASGPTTPYSATATDMFGVAVIDILNYSNTTTNKTVLWRYSGDTNGTGSTVVGVGTVQSTTAINFVHIATYAVGNWVAGTTATLYGIAAA